MIEISEVLGTIKGTFSDIKKKLWVSKNVTDLKIDKNEKEGSFGYHSKDGR